MQRSLQLFGALCLLQFSSACGGSELSYPLNGSGGTAGGGQSAATGGGDSTGPGGAGSALPELPPLPPAVPTASEAALSMGRGFNLGQMFENTQHPRTLEAAKAKIDAYYARGYRNVRVPVTWTEAVGGDTLVNDPTVGDVNRAHARLAVIESVVDYALSKEGMLVVLNAHHEHALKTQGRAAVLERLWQDIADIFQDRDHRLLFEILNEPHLDDTTAMPAAQLRTMTGLAYAKIRSVDTKRIVLIGGNQWFAANEIPAVWTDLEPVGGGSDPYVMATFHHYTPWTFCGDNQGDYSDNWTSSDMETPMKTMQNWADTVGGGMPVYIGEWGVGWGSRYQSMDCNNIRLWYTQFQASSVAALGQPTAVWDDGGWFKIFDHSLGDFGNNLIDCMDGACDWTGTERMNAGCQ